MTKTFATIALIVGCLLASSPTFAQEKVTLTAPVVAPALTEYALRYFAIDIENQRILIELKSNTGELKTVIYRNSDPVTTNTVDANGKPVTTITPSDNKATQLIRALNKADLSVKSLERRIFERLVADGHITGSVVGTPRLPEPEPDSWPLVASGVLTPVSDVYDIRSAGYFRLTASRPSGFAIRTRGPFDIRTADDTASLWPLVTATARSR